MPEQTDSPVRPRRVVTDHRLDDRIYRTGVSGVGIGSFVLLFLIGLFLLLNSLPAIEKHGLWAFLTTTGFTTLGHHPTFGVAALLYWTVIIAVIAIIVGVPVAVATALFITEVAPPRLRKVLVSLIDLLAVVPSVIFGLWGFFMLQPNLLGFARFMTSHLSFIPIFKDNSSLYSSSAFVAGVLVGIMIVPVVCSITRELFMLAPVGEREGALALGATKTTMIRSVVLPFARGGIIGALMLGFGRACGETIAVAIIVSESLAISPHLFQPGASPIAAFIAERFGTGGSLGVAALLGAGFVLFAFTMTVNFGASIIVNRTRSGASA